VAVSDPSTPTTSVVGPSQPSSKPGGHLAGLGLTAGPWRVRSSRSASSARMASSSRPGDLEDGGFGVDCRRDPGTPASAEPRRPATRPRQPGDRRAASSRLDQLGARPVQSRRQKPAAPQLEQRRRRGDRPRRRRGPGAAGHLGPDPARHLCRRAPAAWLPAPAGSDSAPAPYPSPSEEHYREHAAAPRRS